MNGKLLLWAVIIGIGKLIQQPDGYATNDKKEYKFERLGERLAFTGLD